MRTILSLNLLLIASITSYAQVDLCDCPRPFDGKFVNICTLIENGDLSYKKELMAMSCVDLVNDSKETIKEKVNCTWEKYYDQWGCTSSGFPMGDGNNLKFALNQEQELFIDGMVQEFGININLKDPSDGNTLLDFVTSEIERYRFDTDYPEKSDEIQRIYNHLKNDLNAKHSNELTPQDALPYSVKKVKISVPADTLKQYEGKYIAENYQPIYLKIENDKFLCRFGETAEFFELTADSKLSFFRKPTPAFATSEFTFKFNNTTGKFDLIVYQNFRNLLFKKVD
jgi:hypothetical protein